MPRAKTQVPPSPSYKPNVTPPVFVPKESNAPLPNLYAPAYNAQQSMGTPNYNSNFSTFDNPIYTPPSNYQSQPQYSPQPTTPKINYTSLQNYNAAPRGWGQSGSGYKPMSFEKPKAVYSDF